MKILAIDTSARAASAAVCDEERILCESYVDVKLTHSETLMPMLDAMLHCAALTLDDLNYLAVSVGPGSFTGLRIGISAVKGMAFPRKIPCIGVSTLEGLAYNLTGQSCIACCAMDARCKQVYTACFDVEGDSVTRLTADEAITITELEENLLQLQSKKPIIMVGDGALLCYNSFGEKSRYQLAPPQLRYQHANSVCRAALQKTAASVGAGELVPAYLRLPQAERELLKKEGTKHDCNRQ
ncbi:tRNA threonylcarbamoyladenosine biosynthesis protein TsaB [Hydrogenoanaerobacterium saccharovorans]|uniref:tRNA threonylcarbamoyladenosine biosynthesis protein TsaB n=1 Tax=Hydrogenoanaerobacterium saccharovorans TaxID=474960 RepID=A0A1H8A6J6_9FIRM|nr:tRNA (adenosine(37)-N6)-threonylcarbamoyltransferase complex dimerization subunit type 1 TsaB [Hydrogenoanaerobacterium saccharovorans]RPF48138.1 tRNA threonylcarbamoyladenosine biosynthesis protein TsaB [Hydrogenoanaerobacterium saccharovorans]SEM66106.1 tRNA threonylcarbamoyladenosine biosynthesis protein TsaB [Hydrogenoanaerobacterium saccharovorans]